MALYKVFDSPVNISYRNAACSKAAFFVAVVTLIAFAMPLIVAYRSRGFWLKNFVYHEQPDVRFKYQYLMVAEGEATIACGTLTDKIPMDDCFFVKVREVDNTYDRKIDEIHLSLSVNNLELKEIRSIKLFMIFDYKLHGMCPLQMESMIVHEHEFGLPVAKHFFTANLHLNQVTALPCWNNHKDVQFNSSVIPNDAKDNWIEDIIYSYSRRNFSTNLSNQYTVTKYGTLPVIEISVSIAIPEHAIRYKPGLWQELKHFWQQYLAIFLIFYWIMNKIKEYVFRNELLYAWKNVPWKKIF